MINDNLKKFILNNNLIEYKHYDQDILCKINNIISDKDYNKNTSKVYIITSDQFIDLFGEDFSLCKKEYLNEMDWNDFLIKEDVIDDTINSLKYSEDDIFDILHYKIGEYIYIFYN